MQNDFDTVSFNISIEVHKGRRRINWPNGGFEIGSGFPMFWSLGSKAKFGFHFRRGYFSFALVSENYPGIRTGNTDLTMCLHSHTIIRNMRRNAGYKLIRLK